jgi:hypothetical protein
MNNQPRVPAPEKRARSIAKMREVCAAFDEQIAVLEQLIAQAEAENKKIRLIFIVRKESSSDLKLSKRSRRKSLWCNLINVWVVEG